MSRRLIVPLPLHIVAGRFRDPGDRPPAPDARQYTIRQGCPCCWEEPEGVEPVPDLPADPAERTPELMRDYMRRVVESPVGENTAGGSGDLTLVAVHGDETLVTCNRCDLDGFWEEMPDAISDILAGRTAAATAEPLVALPCAPFLPRGEDVLLTGPSGSGKSPLARALAVGVAQAGHGVLYVGGDGPEGVEYVTAGELLPAVMADPLAWLVASRKYALIVIDDVTSASEAVGLNFVRAPEHWTKFHSALVQPCRRHSTVLMLAAGGLPARRQEAAVRLSIRVRRSPLSLIVICERARPVRTPFQVGDRWVFYAGGPAPVVFDEDQEEREREALPDPRAALVAILQNRSPQGIVKLERALRAAGYGMRSAMARRVVKATAEDPDWPVIKVPGKGYGLDAAAMSRPMSRPMSRLCPGPAADMATYVPDICPDPRERETEGKGDTREGGVVVSLERADRRARDTGATTRKGFTENDAAGEA